MLSIKDITIDAELESLLPPLSEDENVELLKSIQRDGFTDPIIVWLGHNILVDGHNRHRIWTTTGMSEDEAPEIIEKQFSNRDAVKEWMLRRQFGRRNLSASQRAALAAELLPILETKGRQKIAETTRRRHETEKTIEELKKSLPSWDDIPAAVEDELKSLTAQCRKNSKNALDKTYFVSLGNDQIKIGVSTSPDERLKNFKTTNPAAAMLGSVNGGREVEKWLHHTLRDYRIADSECFTDCDIVRTALSDISSLAIFSQATETFNAAAEAGKAMDVSPAYVKKAMQLKRDDPQSFEDVKSGKVKITHVSNNSGNNEWYTPVEFVEAARSVLGEIDLDPASCLLANGNINATEFLSVEDDGLSQEWNGRVWLNPPYSQPEIADFARKVVAEVESGRTTEAIVLVNNATETEWGQTLLRDANAVCFKCGRIKFLNSAGVPANTPLQGQMFVYFGKNSQRFVSEFSKFGVCLI